MLARVRSTREPVPGKLTTVDGRIAVALDTLEEGVAPGQALFRRNKGDDDGASVLPVNPGLVSLTGRSPLP